MGRSLQNCSAGPALPCTSVGHTILLVLLGVFMNENDRNNPETKIGAYLTVMVNNGGADLFLHTGAKPTIKGNSRFKGF